MKMVSWLNLRWFLDGTFGAKNLLQPYLLVYKANEKHDIQFTLQGRHNGTTKKFTNPLSDYLKYGSNGEPNIKYNSGWGYKNGRSTHSQKLLPQTSLASINWDFRLVIKQHCHLCFTVLEMVEELGIW
jgi:hypothetical protein